MDTERIARKILPPVILLIGIGYAFLGLSHVALDLFSPQRIEGLTIIGVGIALISLGIQTQEEN